MNSKYCREKGFASLKLMVLTMLLSVLGTLLLPSEEETIRARVAHGLEQADMAKRALTTACRQQHGKRVADNADAGFFFVESLYVAEIRLTADCDAGSMGIRIRTQNTGAAEDPEILLISGTVEGATAADAAPAAAAQTEWRCGLARGQADHVPEACRVALSLG